MTEYEQLRNRIKAARREAIAQDDKGKSWTPGIRVLDDPDDVVAEAKIASQGIGENYGVPKNAEVLETALRRIDAQDLTPAWEVIDGVE